MAHGSLYLSRPCHLQLQLETLQGHEDLLMTWYLAQGLFQGMDINHSRLQELYVMCPCWQQVRLVGPSILVSGGASLPGDRVFAGQVHLGQYY